jgi:DNA-binding NtrC family response regulator
MLLQRVKRRQFTPRRGLRAALEQTRGNIDQAAKLLTWSRNTLTKKMDQFGLRTPRKP